MTDDDVEEALSILEQDEARYIATMNEVGADDSIELNDKQLVACQRLGFDDWLIAPVIHDDEMGMRWCDFCGVEVLRVDKHVRWHLRVQAAVKLAGHVAEIARKRSTLLGWALAQLVTGEALDNGP